MSRIAETMREFHRGTMWEFDRRMTELALEDTEAKIKNYYVLHDLPWPHGRIRDFVSMDEGTGHYQVYVLWEDGAVLQIADTELDEAADVAYHGQYTRAIQTEPAAVEDTDVLADRLLAEKDRLLAEMHM